MVKVTEHAASVATAWLIVAQRILVIGSPQINKSY
jgi:hypothetical protein